MIIEKRFISVIVAAYNEEKYIGRCLRSLLDQNISRNDFEIIVINDGSIDRTEYALSLFHNAIKVINNKKNIGLPASLNKAIKSSNSKYIIRVDADDFVNSNFLNILFQYLESNQNSDAVACDYLLVDDDEEVLGQKDCLLDPIACGILFKRQDIEKIGLYDEDFILNEEVDLRFRFLETYKIDRLPIPLYRYRKHENNMTNNSKKLKFYDNKFKEKHKI